MLFKKFIDRKSDVVRLGEALKRPDSRDKRRSLQGLPLIVGEDMDA